VGSREYHVKTCRLPENAKDLLESGRDYGLSLQELLMNLSRDGLLLRTSPVFYPAMEDKILPSSFAGWQNAGMAFAGGYLTLSISDSPSTASACSLSEVLETDVQRKYFLSAEACRGVLRRAEKRGRRLPARLEADLRAVAEAERMTST
jgi:hypothetical protein